MRQTVCGITPAFSFRRHALMLLPRHAADYASPALR